MKSLPIHLVCLFCVLSPVPILAQAEAGADGLYSTKEDNYRIEVKFVPGKLVVVEPNKTSEYIQRPNTGIYDLSHFVLRKFQRGGAECQPLESDQGGREIDAVEWQADLLGEQRG